MKPSEALLVGVTLCEPLVDETLSIKDGQACGCSLGAMLTGYASTYAKAASILVPLIEEFGFYDIAGLAEVAGLKGAALNKARALAPQWQEQRPCPECDAPHWAGSMMAHLNDAHEWPREAVAGWLATQGL